MRKIEREEYRKIEKEEEIKIDIKRDLKDRLKGRDRRTNRKREWREK